MTATIIRLADHGRPYRPHPVDRFAEAREAPLNDIFRNGRDLPMMETARRVVLWDEDRRPCDSGDGPDGAA